MGAEVVVVEVAGILPVLEVDKEVGFDGVVEGETAEEVVDEEEKAKEEPVDGVVSVVFVLKQSKINKNCYKFRRKTLTSLDCR